MPLRYMDEWVFSSPVSFCPSVWPSLMLCPHHNLLFNQSVSQSHQSINQSINQSIYPLPLNSLKICIMVKEENYEAGWEWGRRHSTLPLHCIIILFNVGDPHLQGHLVPYTMPINTYQLLAECFCCTCHCRLTCQSHRCTFVMAVVLDGATDWLLNNRE